MSITSSSWSAALRLVLVPVAVLTSACPSPTVTEDAALAPDAAAVDAHVDPGVDASSATDVGTRVDALASDDASVADDAIAAPDAWTPVCMDGRLEVGELCFGDPSTIATANMFASPDVAIADVDGDGDQDIVFTDDASATGVVHVLLREMTGAYTTVSSDLLAGSADFELVELTGDDALDLVYLSARTGNVAVARGARDGTFTPVSQASANASLLAVAELTGDAFLDVAVRENDLTGLQILPTDGAGNLGAAISVDAATRPVALAAGDLDGSGTIDLAWIEEVPALSRSLRTAGSWSATSSVALTGSNYTALALRDLDGDDALDAVLGSYLVELASPVSGTPRTLGTSRAYGLALADLDRDGRTDILVGSDSALQVLRDGTGDWVAASGLPMVTGSVRRIAVGDLDADGALDLVLSVATMDGREIVVLRAQP